MPLGLCGGKEEGLVDPVRKGRGWGDRLCPVLLAGGELGQVLRAHGCHCWLPGRTAEQDSCPSSRPLPATAKRKPG